MNLAGMFKQDVTDELGRLIDLSTRLREAMLARDAERIQQVVSEGDGLEPSPALVAATPDLLEDETIHRLTRQLSRMQESNRLLASAFVKLYRNILQPARLTPGGDPGLYGRSGRVESALSGPMLIRQTG